MLSARQIIAEAESLPVEERLLVVDSLLRTLNPPDSEIDRKWGKLAQKRLAELRSGRIKPVPGNAVFAKIADRFSK